MAFELGAFYNGFLVDVAVPPCCEKGRRSRSETMRPVVWCYTVAQKGRAWAAVRVGSSKPLDKQISS